MAKRWWLSIALAAVIIGGAIWAFTTDGQEGTGTASAEAGGRSSQMVNADGSQTVKEETAGTAAGINAGSAGMSVTEGAAGEKDSGDHDAGDKSEGGNGIETDNGSLDASGGSDTVNGSLDTSGPESAGDAKPAPEFAILVNDTVLPLGAWDDQYDLAALLGEPVREENRVLEHADTLNGSFEKTLVYDGLELTLFSPQQNGKTFWIREIRLTSDVHATAAGVRVGMTVEELKSVHPDIGLAPDGRMDPNNAAYRIGVPEDSFSYDRVEFEAENGIITEIRLYRELP